MDHDEEPFLEAIRTEPDSDTPRLIFADFLEETDRYERAEFIRVQCELAHLSEADAEYAALHNREQELLRLYEVAWKADLPSLRGVYWEGYERGFPAAVRVNHPDAFVEGAAAIFRAAPVQTLSLHRLYGPLPERMFAEPGLRCVRTLDLEDGNRIGNAGVEQLVESGTFTGLRKLKLRANGIGPAGVKALANLPNLVHLDLDRNDLYDDGVTLLADHAHFPRLKFLSLGWTRMSDDSLVRLSKTAAGAERLRWLYLTGNTLGDRGVQALAGSERMAGLQALYLENNHLGDPAVMAIASSPYFTELRWLYLKHNRIGDVGAFGLGTSQTLTQIQELALGENRIGGEAGDLLRQRFGKAVWL